MQQMKGVSISQGLAVGKIVVLTSAAAPEAQAGTPEEELARRIPARRFFDRAGRLLHSRPGFDYEWRFPVRLDALPAHLVEITLAVEDRNFHRHDGVDLAASARAFWQFLKHGRIVSGSSTVTPFSV